MSGLTWKLTVALAVLAGCGRKPEPAAAPADTTASMAGMQGMQMMPMMQAHLDSMAGMPAAQMAGMMTAHQDMASRMLDAMGADMRMMNMQPDAAWTALADSVGRDLAELPGLSGDALKSRLEAHIDRMRRMMARHRGMMKM